MPCLWCLCLQYGGHGGGVIVLEASHAMLIDGEIKANGSMAHSPGLGGGAGGSVVLKAAHFSGEYRHMSTQTHALVDTCLQ